MDGPRRGRTGVFMPFFLPHYAVLASTPHQEADGKEMLLRPSHSLIPWPCFPPSPHP